MDQWTIFGSGDYLSDIFDLIHANHGRVKYIVNNVEKTAEETERLHRRIRLLGYEIQLVDLHSFEPVISHKYTFGFMRGRKPVLQRIKNKFGLSFSALIHPSCHLGSHTVIGEGTIIAPGVTIAPNAMLGDFCLINRSASIGHDTRLGTACTIAPGVNIGGMTNIEEQVEIGIGASVINNIHIGENAVIGAGSVVIRNIPPHVTAVGVPANIVNHHKD